MDRRRVHHLHAGGRDAGRDDRRDARARGFHGVEPDQQRARRLRPPQDPHRDLGDDPEQPFGADDETEQIVAAAVEVLAAEPNDVAVGRDELDAEHVVRREAVLQAMHAARILGDVAADRARDLARRIGRVVEALGRDCVADREVGDAGLRDDAAVRVVDVEYSIELTEADDDGVGRRYRAARQRRAGAARHDLHAFARGVAQDRGDFGRRLRQRDGERPLSVRRQRIGLVRREPHVVVDDVAFAHEPAERAHDLGAARDERGVGCRQADHGRD